MTWHTCNDRSHHEPAGPRQDQRARQSGTLRLTLLAACASLLGCKIDVVSGPAEVKIGDTVAYVLEISSTSAVSTFFVAADVPVGWRLDSSTYVGTVGGVPVSGNGLVVQGGVCDSLLGARPGFRRWLIQNPNLPPGLTSSDSAEVTLEFTVESQPAGEFKLYFLLGSFNCSAPEVFTVNRQPGPSFLTLVQQLVDGVGGSDGLGGPVELIRSPDGRHLYVAGGVDGSIGVFSRDDFDGRLSFVEAETEGLDDGLGPPAGLAMSPDGQFLYVPRASAMNYGYTSGILIYARDGATGGLTFVERVIEDVESIVVSPDGLHLYAESGDGAFARITIFARDSSTGRLSFVDSLEGGGDLELSPDGLYLYAADEDIDVFGRDAATGLLSLLGSETSGGSRPAISPDGRHLYALSAGLNVFLRDEATGLLNLVEHVPDLNSEPVASFAESVAVSPAGRYVVVGGQVALTVFQRDPATGSLTLVESQFMGDLPMDGLEGPGALAFDPASRQLYAAGFDDDAIFTFATAVVFSDGFESGTTSAWSSAGP